MRLILFYHDFATILNVEALGGIVYALALEVVVGGVALISIGS